MPRGPFMKRSRCGALKGVDVAQLTQVIVTCDVHDGDAEAVETVSFTVNGHSYECDLCEAHLAEFSESMEDWSSHSRLVGRRRPGRSAGRSVPSGRQRSGSGGGSLAADVREWAHAQGIPVNRRGRIWAEVQAAYDAAH